MENVMNRRDMMKLSIGSAAGVMVAPLAGIADAQSAGNPTAAPTSAEAAPAGTATERNMMKKYTNADFYKNGVFQKDVAFRAFFEEFESLGYALGDKLRGNPEFWVVDFGLGDFENVGMGGIFWLNDKENRYFGHDIYLLPYQMIPEHYHLPAEGLPAKHESWLVKNGSIFNFGKGGELNDNLKGFLPKSQLDGGFITCFTMEELHVGDLRSLTALEDRHFMMGGIDGAIVTEFGTYHSMQGLNFTNKKAAL